MKYLTFSISLIIIVTLTHCGKVSSDTVSLSPQISLNEGWEFRKKGDSAWLPAVVPGTVHTDLLANKLIGDPFFRVNERDQQWIDKADWEYRLIFNTDTSMLSFEKAYLNFEGLDTYADIWLNKTLLLTADNMFRSWEEECRDILKPGRNELRILFHSPVNKGLQKLGELGYQLPAGMDQSFAGGLGAKGVSIFTRKAPFHYGWDWGPRLVTSGIWRPVTLSFCNPVRLKNPNFITVRLSKGEATIRAEFDIESEKDLKGSVDLIINGNKVLHRRVISGSGVNHHSLSFKLPHPRLWWPNGSGEHYLYKAEIHLNSGNKTVTGAALNFGVRKIELVRLKDASGRSFFFRINDRPVFVKGANYIPPDIFLPRKKNEDYEKIISDAAKANMNMLRVWGGGTYENDYFYSLCDKYGIMIWQDFMFACSMYPGDSDFLDNIKKEAENVVLRLRNHPCISLWCGNNEMRWAWGPDNQGWGWKQYYSIEQQNFIWETYQNIFNKILPGAISEYNPEISYWESSPMSDPRDSTDYTFDLNTGDVHLWNIWQGQKLPISEYNNIVGRFMSEYGFQSMPLLSSLRKFADEKDLNLNSEVMASHQRAESGYQTMKEYMQREYRIPDDFEHFLYISQIQQAEAIKTAIEAHRRSKPFCMGTLYWQLNDCWPAASWSGIDYYGTWKALHYQVRRSYDSCIISFARRNDSLSIYTVSDGISDFKGDLIVTITDFNGNVKSTRTKKVAVSSERSILQESGRLESYTAGSDSSQIVLNAMLKVNGEVIAENNYYFVPVKDLKLKKPDIGLSAERIGKNYLLNISSGNLVRNLYVSYNGKGTFSDNFFDLLPGRIKHITYIPEDTIPLVADSVRFLSVNDAH